MTSLLIALPLEPQVEQPDSPQVLQADVVVVSQQVLQEDLPNNPPRNSRFPPNRPPHRELQQPLDATATIITIDKKANLFITFASVKRVVTQQ